MLLREAYDESTPDTPILMLITHSVEVLDAVKEFQQKIRLEAAEFLIKFIMKIRFDAAYDALRVVC